MVSVPASDDKKERLADLEGAARSGDRWSLASQ